MKLKAALKKFFSSLKSNNNQQYTPCYRIAEIIQLDEGEYNITVQLINKSMTFKAKPEEILADDRMVDQFAPRDIRTLTYLGYLGINSPKYKILAKRLSENDDKLVFAIKKRGDKKILTKTAEEIMRENEILESLHPKDAHNIGYTVASESVINEKKQKEALLAAAKKQQS